MITPDFHALETTITVSGDLSHDLQSHAAFYYHVGVGAARADAEEESLKYALTCKESELQELLRREAAAASEKVTEALIMSRIKLHPEYQTAYLAYLQAAKSTGEWKALLRAYEARSHCLHDLSLLATKTDISGIAQYAELRKAAATRRTALRP